MTDKKFEDRFNEKPARIPGLWTDGNMRHCIHCDRPVKPVKIPSLIIIAVLIVLLIFMTVIGAILSGVYLIYFIFLQRKECPICRGNSLRRTDKQREDLAEIKRSFSGK
ncbi:hypothetical protein [Paenibacillus marchantiophytorum]|uniref:hypothetical protein n=1 Tax=Paenibacillus marchantiophytorum TaxID=1619310 RepID=UPI00166428BF|nr:hypothetical protein [Paenibacillus marchantiophytorum]